MPMSDSPSRFSELRALIAQLGASYKIYGEFIDIIDDLYIRLYALQEDNKRILANYRVSDQNLKSVREQYSELLYKFADLKEKVDKLG